MNLKYFCAIIIFVSFQSIFGQLSKTHFIPPLTSNNSFSDQYIYISTPKNKDVAYKITAVGNSNQPAYRGIVSNSNPVTQAVLDEFGNENFTGDSQLHVPLFLSSSVLTDRGFIIEAEDVVYVSVRVRSSVAIDNNGNPQKYHAGALVSKGNSALGLNFRIGGFVRAVPTNNDTTFGSIMATEDDTTVTIDGFINGVTLENYSGTFPLVVNLDKGESYIVAAQANQAKNIIGGLISSNKNIVVNSGSAIGSFGDRDNNADYGFDQIVGVSKIGKEYILVKGAGTIVEKVLVIAHENNTEIVVNEQFVATINAGDYYIAESFRYSSSGNMFIKTTKPVFVYQGVGGLGNDGNPSQANQGMFFVPPLSCENKGDVNNIANIDKIGDDFFAGGVTIVTNTGGTVTINGKNITEFNTSGPFNVIGNPNYVTYKVKNLTGDITVQSDKELYCAYFNQNGSATTGSFYSGFPSAPEINFNTTVSSLGNCIPNVTLQAANTDLFDSFRWEYFDDSTTTWVQKSTNAEYKPVDSEPGNYRLIGTVNCTGATFESAIIPVSICPDDFDGDLIIDNLDVDIDNDGILNCDESIGNATLNLADIANPSIIFRDTSTNSTIISSAYTASVATNTFIGENNGNFISTQNANTSSNSSYELNFTQNINFSFSQNKTANHVISDGEFFTLKVTPNNKNITLIDPDDQLLIDTDFDGKFETEVTNFSALEIRFKYKANLSGAASTFKFVANQVNQIYFEHKSVGTVTDSTFSGNIQLTCFSLDSDGDGIENMFDADSDNDGIPDILESSSQKITLLNIDANQDGLDDAFEGVTTNIDTDSDGVPNYLDLDSDNDGIFDLVEAGHLKTDANNDGILDDANATSVGINGILNSLETVADAKILALNFTVLDTDADNILNFLELDADNDDCNDVIEAGFTDQNNDGYLGNSPINIDVNGVVISGSDGYTVPNANYITSAPIEITQFADLSFCELETNTITIVTNADTYQWQVSTDNGATFTNTINNPTRYSGSNSKDLVIIATPLSFNNHLYKVILNKTGNTCGKESNSIKLTVNPKPIVTAVVELKQCDTDADKITTVNLTEAEISISTNPDVIFQYFATENDALNGSPQVSDKTSYPVNGNTPQSAWVRTISKFDCFIISKINLFVSFTPNQPYEETFVSCDDFLDMDGNNTNANSDTDGIAAFNFSIAPSQISTDPDIEIEFYETESDRTKSINKIRDTQSLSNYRNKNIPNTTGNRFPIFYKLISKTNNDCSGLGQIYLRLDPVPVANSVTDLELCDDLADGNATNGIVDSFDLKSQTLAILGTQSNADFTVTYHDSATNANLGNNVLTSPFTNTVRDSQTIYVRIVNNTNGCFTDHTTFNVVVNPLPTANFVPDLEVCDDNTDGSARNGFSSSIDLESQTATILGMQNPLDFKVTYHISLADAQAGNSSLVSPYQNSTPNRETIYVRVFNANTQCANGISNFDVIINPEPTFEVISNLSYCDNDLDGDDANGIIQNIDLDSQISNLLGSSQDPDDYIVTFYNSQTDATNGSNRLESPYTNSLATETIFVRIQNNKTSCFNDDASFDIIINPLPEFTVTTPQIICLNNLPLTISAENPRGVYTYVWTNPNGDVISNTETATVSSGGLYSIKATKTDGTTCGRTRTIQVNESIIAALSVDDITVIDDADNNSISINNLNQNLGIGDYEYALENSSGMIIRNYQDETIFENLDGEIYTVLVKDKNGCGIARIQIPVVQFPQFFSPNGDGKNDTWIIKGANRLFFPNSEINIFNRYGKLVAKIPLDSNGWDGSYNGKLLPSDDYWFSIKLIDTSGNLRERVGNFSLLRK